MTFQRDTYDEQLNYRFLVNSEDWFNPNRNHNFQYQLLASHTRAYPVTVTGKSIHSLCTSFISRDLEG